MGLFSMANRAPSQRSAFLASFGAVGFGALLGTVMGVGAAILLWGQSPAVVPAAAWAFGTWIAIGVFVSAMLVLLTRGRPASAPLYIMGASFARMIGALSIALGVYFIAQPEGRPFWIVFLLAGLGSLAGEVLWAVKSLAGEGAHASPSNGVS